MTSTRRIGSVPLHADVKLELCAALHVARPAPRCTVKKSRMMLSVEAVRAAMAQQHPECQTRVVTRSGTIRLA